MKRAATSPTGWWIAGLLEKHNHADGAPYWNNYRLVRAKDWRTAFQRATEMGRRNAEACNEAFADYQEFIGISDLQPIYDKIEDGAEVLWEEVWPDEAHPDLPTLRTFSEADLAQRFEEDQTSCS